jgi:cell division protease FtsH
MAPPKIPKRIHFSLWYVLVAVFILMAVQNFLLAEHIERFPYSDFKRLVREDRVEHVRLSQELVRGTFKAQTPRGGESRPFVTIRVEDPDLVRELVQHNVRFSGEIEHTFLKNLLGYLIPMLVLLAIWGYVFRRMGPGASVMTLGKNKAKIYAESEVKVTFGDVAGIDEAKEELKEIVAFLKTPEKFRRLGGRIPKGILLVGPPGTGKTLLAKAVAGEAGVPFFSLSGSDFVELFVGLGAARVRDLFEQAQKRAPCIIFIDELDALGKARGANPLGGHDEREQTLNQLLAEMDGFDTQRGVIIMGATNRPEILDAALLRPGRFDRQILVDRPDRKGREAILQVHARNVALAPGADLRAIAAETPGFAGADLANVINEAALLAARRDQAAVEQADLHEAVERVVAGLEKKSRVLNKKEREIVAYHEAGHALVAASLPTADPVRKVSIIPRGIAALGYTLQMPTEDRYLMTRSELLDRLAALLGGRVAEELTFGEVSTGAQNDLQRASDIARRMVKDYGMSAKLGLVSFERERAPAFLPPQLSMGNEYSEETARSIDAEVGTIVHGAHVRVRQILTARRADLERLAKLLLEREVVEGAELAAVLGDGAGPGPSRAG